MNTNINVLAAAMIGVLALAHAPLANAYDEKAHHGSECKVYGSTAWTDLGFGWQGIYNTTTSPRVIVCPLTKDSETDWDGSAVSPVNAAWVDFHYRAGGPASSITCTVYSSRTSTLTSSKTVTVNISAGSESQSNITNLDSPSGWWNDVGTIMICNLGGKATLQHYRLIEPAATHS